MSTGPWTSRVSVVVIMLTYGAWVGLPVAAQDAAQTAGLNEVELDPITCWWKTDRSAVQVGEQFSLLLTCSVIDTARVRVEADVSEFDPSAIALVPFEVLGGTRFEDIQAPPRRYFQYAYTMRLVGDEFFGQDVDIPTMQVTYNVNLTSGDQANGDQTEGVERLYELPSLPMRILSLVPATATDIRDPSSETFGDIETRRFRATAALVASGIFFVAAVLLVGLAAVRIIGRYRTRVPAVARLLSSGKVLRGCLNAVDRLRSDVALKGWTPELGQRALALLRIGGAVALGRPIVQTVVDDDVQEREGQLVLRKGRLRPKRTMVSAPTTAAAVAAELATGSGPGSRATAVLEGIRDSLHVFSAARYGRDGQLQRDGFDTALDRGASAILELYVMKLWPMRAVEVLKGWRLGVAAWSR